MRRLSPDVRKGLDEEIGKLKSYWAGIVDGYRDQPPDDILVEDEGFHLLIAELSGNPEIVNQLQAINARIRFIRRIQIEHSTHNNDLVDAHSKIVDAAVRRATNEGVDLLRKHIELTVSSTQLALKDALLRVYSPGEPKVRQRRTPQVPASD